MGKAYTNSYYSAAQTTLEIGFTKYGQGFQMKSSACWTQGACATRVNYTWRIPSRYKLLKADVGYDLTDVCTGSTIAFLGQGGRSLHFTSVSGKVLGVMSVPANGATQIKVDIAGNSVLTIHLHIGFRAPTGYAYKGSCGGEYNSVIDIVNDGLS
jgi:hypothetical protein